MTTIEANSTYDFIKELLKNDKELDFSLDESLGVIVSLNPEDKANKEIDEKLGYSIYEFMNGYIEPLKIVWADNYTARPELIDDKLVFNVSLYSVGQNRWEIYDPITERCVINIYDTLYDLLLDRMPEIPISDCYFYFRLSIDFKIQDSNVETFKVLMNLSEDYMDENNDVGVYREIKASLPKIKELVVKEIIEAAVEEHNTIVVSQGIKRFSFELKIDEAPLDDIMGYADYSSFYEKTINDDELKPKLSDNCSYEMNI
jgi:hypothetical protein